ncbi:hypothetical protein EAS56_15540 [Bradyrhizobium guangzhouense]|uniref:Uncharacterized protein n=1 Tax=Bradyrhizobium guangzhouense TaxID=1325095 RepID=A0AAE5X1S4_9BRAD|nr:hypothetical protein XH91_17515 [Bradyrhizobium guangzhouense]RXH12917.1 hypothetical protein EAS56_15540 [Bradyrhizobium guangzhouense]
MLAAQYVRELKRVVGTGESGGLLHGGTTERAARLTSQHMLVQVFEHVPIPALMVLLGVGKQDHKAYSDHNASGYEVLHHALQGKL